MKYLKVQAKYVTGYYFEFDFLRTFSEFQLYKGPSIKDVRKGGGGLSKADVCGRGGLGKCGRPQNFRDFPQNSI